MKPIRYKSLIIPTLILLILYGIWWSQNSESKRLQKDIVERYQELMGEIKDPFLETVNEQINVSDITTVNPNRADTIKSKKYDFILKKYKKPIVVTWEDFGIFTLTGIGYIQLPSKLIVKYDQQKKVSGVLTQDFISVNENKIKIISKEKIDNDPIIDILIKKSYLPGMGQNIHEKSDEISKGLKSIDRDFLREAIRSKGFKLIQWEGTEYRWIGNYYALKSECHLKSRKDNRRWWSQMYNYEGKNHLYSVLVFINYERLAESEKEVRDVLESLKIVAEE